MSEIILVRHGQANSHATDDASYDKLSDLGRQQARWLGAHLAQTNPHFDRVITGTLQRQGDTALEMGYEITRRDAAFDELSYFKIAGALEAEHGIAMPTTPLDYAQHLPVMLAHWESGAITGAPESFEAFYGRIQDGFAAARAAGGRTLIVTSGGVIGMIVRAALGLDNSGTAKVMLQIMNASLHRLEYVQGQQMLGTFNATPHLDMPDRAHARTFV